MTFSDAIACALAALAGIGLAAIIDMQRTEPLIVLKGTSSVEHVKAFRAVDADRAYELARKEGYTTVAIHSVN